MPTYEIDTPNGRYDVEAPSFDAAVSAIKANGSKVGIGFGRAAAQGALIDAPEALGSLYDLAAKVFRMRGEPLNAAAAARGAGESLIGPRRQGTTGEEALATTVSGGVQAVPFMLGAGPLAAAAGVAGGALGNLGQFGVEQAGGGSLAGTGANVAINVAAALAARNAGKLSGLLTGGKAAETALEAVPVPKPTVVSAEDLTQGWVKETLSDGSIVARAPTGEGAHAANVAAKTIPTEVRIPPGKAGNINLAMLDTPEGVKQVIRDVSDEYGGFMEARRGVVPHAETEALARDLGWEASDLTARRTGARALNAHELEAGRMILLKTGSALDDARAVLRADPSVENIASFQDAFTKHVAVQEAMAGYTAESGRALNILGKMAGIQSQAARTRKLIELAGGPDRAVTIARMMDEMPTVGAANKFGRDAIAAKTSEKVIEAWKAGMLTGPPTHVVNFTSNAVTQALTAAEDALAGVGRAVAGDKSALYGIAGRAFGMRAGLMDGLKNAWHAIRAEEGMATARAMETAGEAARVGALGGRLGRIVRFPFRMLTASDQLFRTFGTQSKLYQLAFEKAYRGGARGAANIAERAKVLAQNPDVIREAEEFGKYAVFQKDLGKTGRALQGFIQSHPAGQVIVPFYKTPTNIFKFAAERTPFSLAFREVREAIRQGGQARAEALARIGLGSAVMAEVARRTLDGQITGSGPDEPAARAAWLQENQPYSIKIGDRWISYGRIEPFASLFGTAADAASLYQYMTPKEREHMASELALIAAHNFTNKTYLRGVSGALLGLFQPQQYGETWSQSLAGSVVPNILTQIGRTEDPILRDARGIFDSVKARVPIVKESLPARINPIDGKPIAFEGGAALPDIASPFYQKHPANDPVSMEMVRLHMGIGKPDKMLDGTELSPQEFETLSRRAGELGHERALRKVTDPHWKYLKDDEDRRERLRKIYDEARARARNELRRQRRQEMRR